MADQIKNNYDHLSDITSYQQEMEGQSVEQIIETVCREENQNQLRKKQAFFALRWINQNEQTQKTDEKVGVLVKTSGLLIDGFGIGAQVGAAFLGGTTTPMGMFSQALGQGLTQTSSYWEKRNNATITGIDFHKERLSNFYHEGTQQIQTAERDLEQASNMLTKTTDRTDQMFKSIASGS